MWKTAKQACFECNGGSTFSTCGCLTCTASMLMDSKSDGVLISFLPTWERQTFRHVSLYVKVSFLLYVTNVILFNKIRFNLSGVFIILVD